MISLVCTPTILYLCTIVIPNIPHTLFIVHLAASLYIAPVAVVCTEKP